jgi:protein TonB
MTGGGLPSGEGLTGPTRTSRICGLIGAALVHGILLPLCLVLSSQAVPKPLPPAVEAVRITLAEPAAAPRRERTIPSPSPAPLPATEESLRDNRDKASPPERENKKTPKDRAPGKPLPKPSPEARKRTPAPASSAPAPTVSPAEQAKKEPGPEDQSRARATAVEARQTLLSALIARIEREKRYPATARRLGLEGLVTAVVRVDGQGNIVGVSARGEGAHAALEKAALETLQRVRDGWTPIPVPEPLTVHIPVRFSLKNF